MKVWINGKLVDKDQANVSVFDHGLLYGDGVFEGIRAYGGKVFQGRAHVDRLFESAGAIRLEIPAGREQILEAIRKTMEANGAKDAYIRLVVTRGAGTLGLEPNKCSGGTMFIIVDQVALYPKEMYDNGMAVIIAKTRRTSATMVPPSVKSLNYLNNILAKVEAVDAGAPEALMLNAEGELAEATGDNVFIVRGGTVITPPAAAGILMGITRKVVLDLCGEAGIPVKEQPVAVEQLYSADECFLTGTAAEVIAVTKVDGHVIGDGRPGPITRRLLAAFRELIRSGQFD
jgi:branched-chain amino acid aminotransferase